MKILYITQYFIPEIGATSNRAYANAKCLSEKGHKVVILTEIPNHPKGQIFDDYKRKIFIIEKLENFFVNRVWVYTNQKKNFLTRLLFYCSFMFCGIIYTLFNWKKYDIIYVTSPPLFVGSIGLFLKKIFRNAKFIFEVRDLWPDAAIEMGELKNKHFRKFSYALEKSLYQNADHIVAVTKRFKRKIIEKGFTGDKISVIRNGSDLSFRPVEISEELKKKFQADNNFIVIYAGILGLAQNLRIIIDAAKKLENAHILFLLLGTGPEENKLKDYAQKLELRNLKFLGEIPTNEMSGYFSLANCGIIPLRNIEVFKSTIPSKLFDYMSAALPILLGVKGEAALILNQSKAGITFEPDDSEDLAEKIIYLQSNPNLLLEMKTKGRRFVKHNYNRKILAAKLEKLLNKINSSE
ncbi:glycosyltransferase WbuB [bacterium]|nr:MAG: glycosyltransferase WbuB [bacterium]